MGLSDCTPAIFEILIDEEELGNDYLPFGDISGMSNFGNDEGEVLLCMGTIMEIKSVDLIDGVVWIRLCMCQSDNSFRNEKSLDSVRHVLQLDFCDELPFLYIGIALLVRGEYRKGEQVLNQMKPTEIPFIDTFREILLNLFKQPQSDLYGDTVETTKNTLQNMYKMTLSALENTELPNSVDVNLAQWVEQKFSLLKDSNFTFTNVLESLITDSGTEGSISRVPEMHSMADPSFIATVSDQLKASVDGALYSGSNMPICVSQILVDYAIEKRDYNQAIRLSEEILSSFCPEDQVYITYKKLAWLYKEQGNISASIECLRKFISKSEFSPNSLDKVNACIDCGDLYMKTNDHAPALFYYKQALDIVQQHYPSDHPLIGRIFIKMGDYFSKTSDNQSAIEYYDRAIKLNHHEIIREAYRNIGIIHSNQTDNLPREYLIKNMNIEENKKPLNSIHLSYLYKSLIELEHRTENYEQRDMYVDRLLKLANNDEHFQDSIMETIQSVLETIE